MSANYNYIIHWISQEIAAGHAPPDARILDFGCGEGAVVKTGLAENLDIWGTDIFHGITSYHYEDSAHPLLQENMRIVKMQDGKIPFPDHSFDIVVSNQVFEHVEDIDMALAEIKRVLKPGGLFLSLFPTQETWYEGHCKLYFAHWMKNGSSLQLAYLALMYKLGKGYRDHSTPPVRRHREECRQWAQAFSRYMAEGCFYRSNASIHALWQQYFSTNIVALEDSWALFRLKAHHRLAPLAGLLDNPLTRPLLAFAARKRGGRVFMIRDGRQPNCR